MIEIIFNSAMELDKEHLKDFFKCVREVLNEIPDRRYWELYESIYGEHFCKELAEKAVARMQNTDGTYGEHFSLEVCNKAAEALGVKFYPHSHIGCYDWYFVINMLYSDHASYFKQSDINFWAKFALNWLTDEDVGAGKAYRYYKCVVKELKIDK